MFIEKREDYRTELERVKDYRSIFGSEIGKKVLWDIAKACHFLRTTYAEEPHRMALHEGERNVILRLMAILDSDPNKIKERMKQQGEDNE